MMRHEGLHAPERIYNSRNVFNVTVNIILKLKNKLLLYEISLDGILESSQKVYFHTTLYTAIVIYLKTPIRHI